MLEKRPQVGLGVIVVKGGRALVGRRKNAHGAGLLAFPGGHLEFMETYAQCAEREVLEETGMAVKFRPFLDCQEEAFVTNDLMEKDNKHYITIYVICDWVSGEAVIKEPEKVEKWQWLDYGELMDAENAWYPKNKLKETWSFVYWGGKDSKSIDS